MLPQLKPNLKLKGPEPNGLNPWKPWKPLWKLCCCWLSGSKGSSPWSNLVLFSGQKNKNQTHQLVLNQHLKAWTGSLAHLGLSEPLWPGRCRWTFSQLSSFPLDPGSCLGATAEPAFCTLGWSPSSGRTWDTVSLTHTRVNDATHRPV